LEGKP
jgi:hypothetical protein